MTMWTGKQIAEYVKQPPEIKINPNGVDVRVSEIWKLPENGISTIHGKIRTIEPEKIKIEADSDGFYILPKGTYELRIANKITIPDTAAGLILPRSTFNRLGILKSESALWDSGYSGYGTQTIRVTIQELRVHKDEQWFQLIFMDMKEKVDQLYEGHWQNEKSKD